MISLDMIFCLLDYMVLLCNTDDTGAGDVAAATGRRHDAMSASVNVNETDSHSPRLAATDCRQWRPVNTY